MPSKQLETEKIIKREINVGPHCKLGNERTQSWKQAQKGKDLETSVGVKPRKLTVNWICAGEALKECYP